MCTFSQEHQKFLIQKKKEKRWILFWQLLLITLFLLGWEFSARFGFTNTFLSSSPSGIIKTIGSLLQEKTLFSHIYITTYETLISFLIASVVGFLIATLLWSNRILAKVLDPYLTILNSLPKVALGPLLIIWVGASIQSIIVMALLISTFITILNIYNGFVATEKNYIRLLESLGAKKLQIFFKVVVPSNYATIINSLKINISMSLIGT